MDRTLLAILLGGFGGGLCGHFLLQDTWFGLVFGLLVALVARFGGLGTKTGCAMVAGATIGVIVGFYYFGELWISAVVGSVAGLLLRLGVHEVLDWIDF